MYINFIKSFIEKNKSKLSIIFIIGLLGYSFYILDYRKTLLNEESRICKGIISKSDSRTCTYFYRVDGEIYRGEVQCERQSSKEIFIQYAVKDPSVRIIYSFGTNESNKLWNFEPKKVSIFDLFYVK